MEKTTGNGARNEVGLLLEGKARDDGKKGSLYIEVTNDTVLKKGDRIYLNDPKDYFNFLLNSDRSSDKQKQFAEKEIEALSNQKKFIKKRLILKADKQEG